MEMLHITLTNAERHQFAQFRFAVGHRAMSVLEQLDFEEEQPVYPDGSPVPEYEVAKMRADGIDPPRVCVINVPTCLELLAAMDAMPAEREGRYRPDMFGLQRTIIEKAMEPVNGNPAFHVHLMLMSILQPPPEMQGDNEFKTE